MDVVSEFLYYLAVAGGGLRDARSTNWTLLLLSWCYIRTCLTLAGVLADIITYVVDDEGLTYCYYYCVFFLQLELVVLELVLICYTF